MTTAAKKMPSAAQRTVSLFTGKTDLESDLSRDGTIPEKTRRPARDPFARFRWAREGNAWEYIRELHSGDRIAAKLFPVKGGWSPRIYTPPALDPVSSKDPHKELPVCADMPSATQAVHDALALARR